MRHVDCGYWRQFGAIGCGDARSKHAAMRQLLYSDVKKKSVLSQKTTVTLQRRKGKVGIKPENDNSFTAA